MAWSKEGPQFRASLVYPRLSLKVVQFSALTSKRGPSRKRPTSSPRGTTLPSSFQGNAKSPSADLESSRSICDGFDRRRALRPPRRPGTFVAGVDCCTQFRTRQETLATYLPPSPLK